METTLAQIIDILKEYGNKPSKLNSDTTIQSLQMVSEDLTHFFFDFKNKFNVNLTGYNYYNFFLEDVHPYYRLRDLFYRIFKPEKLKRTPLTLDHLVKVAEKGKWFDPE